MAFKKYASVAEAAALHDVDRVFVWQPDVPDPVTERTGVARSASLRNVGLFLFGESLAALQASLAQMIPLSQKGAANGVATLGEDGFIPVGQIPGSVKDVVTFASLDAFPEQGSSSKIYVAADTNKQYLWDGASYRPVPNSLALGETEESAFAGNRGKNLEESLAALNAAFQALYIPPEFPDVPAPDSGEANFPYVRKNGIWSRALSEITPEATDEEVPTSLAVLTLVNASLAVLNTEIAAIKERLDVLEAAAPEPDPEP